MFYEWVKFDRPSKCRLASDTSLAQGASSSAWPEMHSLHPEQYSSYHQTMVRRIVLHFYCYSWPGLKYLGYLAGTQRTHFWQVLHSWKAGLTFLFFFINSLLRLPGMSGMSRGGSNLFTIWSNTYLIWKMKIIVPFKISKWALKLMLTLSRWKKLEEIYFVTL